jgi:hypothetical protein
VAFEPGHLLWLHRATQLVDEPRFPDSRVTHERDHLPATADGAGETLPEDLELSLAADQRGETAIERSLQTGAGGATARDAIHGDRARTSLDLHGPERACVDIPLHESVSRLRDHDLSRPGGGLQTGREVGGVAHCRVVHPEVVTDRPDDHDAAVQALANLDRDATVPGQLLAVSSDGLADRDRCLHGADRMPLEGHGGAEERHEAVPINWLTVPS